MAWLVLALCFLASSACFPSSHLWKTLIQDAIILSSCAGPALWESTRELFFKKHTKPFVRNVVRLVVGHDLDNLVQESDLRKWRETLAILLTYSSGEDRDRLIN